MVEEWAKKYDEDLAEDDLREEFNKEWSENSVEYRRKCAAGYLLFEYFSDQILVQNEIKRSGLSHIEQIADQVQLLKVAQNLPNLLKDDDFTNNSLFRNLPFTANNVMPKAKAVVET